MKKIANATRKIIFVRQFSEQTQTYKPIPFFVQQIHEGISLQLKVPLSKLGKLISNDPALDEKTRSSLLRSIKQSEALGVPEELEQMLDKITGSRIHENSRYDSSRPNERSTNKSAFYEPSIYNIEEMDAVDAAEESAHGQTHGLSHRNDQKKKSG